MQPIKIVSVILISLLLLVICITGVAVVFQAKHMLTMSIHTAYDDHSMNFKSKACEQYSQFAEFPESQKGIPDWKKELIGIRCIVFSSPYIRDAYQDLDNLISVRKHSESINSALATIIALISFIFAAFAWFGGSTYLKYKQHISLVDKEIQKLQNQTKSFMDKLVAISRVQDEIITNLKSDGHDVSNATKDSIYYKPALDLFLSENPSDYKNAFERLSSLYHALEPEQCPEFIKLLDLCQKRHENEIEFLSPDKYFS